jgi:hypothetical protein
VRLPRDLGGCDLQVGDDVTDLDLDGDACCHPRPATGPDELAHAGPMYARRDSDAPR